MAKKILDVPVSVDRPPASGRERRRSPTSQCWYAYPASPPRCACTPTPSKTRALATHLRSGEWLCRCLFHRPPASPQVPARP
jgi:hypothetical protein